MIPPEDPQLPSSSAAWEEVDELLFHCLELPADQQAEAFEAICQRRADLADKLRRAWDKLTALEMTSEQLAGSAGGEDFGDFRVLGRLGSGGMGVVDLALQKSLGRRVALKRIRPDHLGSEAARARFLRESRIASRTNHPNICPVHEAGEHDGVPYLVMPFVPGAPLQEWIREGSSGTGSGGSGSGAGRRQRIEEAVSIGARIGRALHAAHGEGLLHRDVKPGNILLAADGVPYLVDFGLASSEDDDLQSLTGTDHRPGTLPYMAPEQLDGEKLDPRVDVYGLGVTLFEAVTGRLPFDAGRADLPAAIRAGASSSARQLMREVPVELDLVLARAMDPDRRRRYADAAEFAADLERVLAREPVRASRLPVALRATRWVQRHPVWASVMGSLTVGVVVLTVLLLQLVAANRSTEAAGLRLRSQLAMVSDETLSLQLAVDACEADPTYDNLVAVAAALHECREVARFPLGSGAAAIRASAGVDRLLAFDRGGEAAVFDVSSGQPREVASEDLSDQFTVPGMACQHAAISDDGSVVMLSCAAGRNLLMIAWWPDSGRHMTIPITRGPVVGLRFAPDGKTVAAAGIGGVQLLQLEADSAASVVALELPTSLPENAGPRYVRQTWWLGDRLYAVVRNRIEGVLLRIDLESSSTEELCRWRADANDRRVCRVDPVSQRVFVPVLEEPDDFLTFETFDLEAGTWLELGLRPPLRSVFDLAVSPDGDRIAYSAGASVHLADRDGALIEALPLGDQQISWIRFTSDGSKLCATSTGQAVHVYDVAGRAEVFTLDALDDVVRGQLACLGGRFLAVVTGEGALRFWSLEAQRGLLDRHLAGSGGFGYLRSDGDRVFGGVSGPHSVVRLDVATGDVATLLDGDIDRGISLIGRDPTSDLLVVGRSGEVALLDPHEGGMAERIPTPGRPRIGGARLLAGPRRAVVAIGFTETVPPAVQLNDLDTGGCRVWADDLSVTARLHGTTEVVAGEPSGPPAQHFNALEIADERWAVLVDRAGFVRVLDLERDDLDAVAAGRTVVRPFVWHDVERLASAPIGRLAWHATSRTLAASSRDGVIHLLHLDREGHLQPLPGTLQGHTAFVESLRFSADGGLLASSSFDATHRIWDVASRSSRFVLPEEGRAVGCAWLPPLTEGELRVLATGTGARIREWRLGPVTVELARDRLRRLGLR